MQTAFVFPGQGSQRVGMGREFAETFPASREVFAEADRILQLPLSRLCFEGPEEELQLTENTQPAILAASIAIHRVVAERCHRPDVMAGHSLGEYSALVAAGALDLAAALRLVRRRGELMQEAVPLGEGAMAAVLGLEQDAVERVAAEAAAQSDAVCALANLNAPGQFVLAGHRAAIERALEIAQQHGARRSLLLPVSAPFHCPLMKPAREAMEPLLREAEFRDPRVSVVCNVDAAPVETASAARDALIRQIDRPVRWIESVGWMRERGVVDFVEIGAGGVLAGLIRRIDRSLRPVGIGEPEDLEKLETQGGGAC